MTDCAECAEFAQEEDYLCQEHRDKLDGAKYCAGCEGRFIPGDAEILCEICEKKDQCEYCGKAYSARKFTATKRKGRHGTRFMGLCGSCKQIAAASVPIMEEL